MDHAEALKHLRTLINVRDRRSRRGLQDPPGDARGHQQPCRRLSPAMLRRVK
jgi:hypothetical protein